MRWTSWFCCHCQTDPKVVHECAITLCVYTVSLVNVSGKQQLRKYAPDNVTVCLEHISLTAAVYKVRGHSQGQGDPKAECNTLQPQYGSTQKVW